MHTETVRTGAAVTRRIAKKNPMETLVELVECDPTADHNRLFRQWWPIIQADPDLLEAVGRYAFTNFASSLDRDRRKPRQKTTAAAMAERRREVAKLSQRISKVVLMNFAMPNGKKLKDCTFAECSAAGGWFKVLATKGKPSEIVGKKLTEQDLHRIR